MNALFFLKSLKGSNLTSETCKIENKIFNLKIEIFLASFFLAAFLILGIKLDAKVLMILAVILGLVILSGVIKIREIKRSLSTFQYSYEPEYSLDPGIFKVKAFNRSEADIVAALDIKSWHKEGEIKSCQFGFIK